MITNWTFFSVCFALHRFPFAQSIANANREGRLLELSCHNRCNETTTPSGQKSKSCMCDQACLLLSDCCYDYLMICSSQKLNFNNALAQQANFRRKFYDYASCAQINGKCFRIVNLCPQQDNSSLYSSQCAISTYKSPKGTMSSFIPVVAKAIPFYNIYCAACHGMLMKDVHYIRKTQGLQCENNSILPTPWSYFNHRLQCQFVKFDIDSKHEMPLKRLMEDCRKNPSCPVDDCVDEKYQEECDAYRAIQQHIDTAKNEACLSCLIESNKTITRKARGQWCFNRYTPITEPIYINLFQFIEFPRKSLHCPKLHSTGHPGTICLMRKCQLGFRLHENECMSTNNSMACFERHENIYSARYNIANFFRPALLVIFKTGGNHQPMEYVDNRKIIWKHSTNCSVLREPAYHKLLNEPNLLRLGCYIIYMDPVSFAKVVQMIESGQLEDKVFRGLLALKIVALNHDPGLGLQCSRNVGYDQLTHRISINNYTMKFRSTKAGRPFISDRDPLIVVKDVAKQGISYHAIFCRRNTRKNGCSLNINDSYSAYEICPKYELLSIPESWKDAMMLMNGDRITVEEYVYSKNGCVYVCSDAYDKMYPQFKSPKLMSGIVFCYSLSLLSLLATFIIYMRHPALRTKPGLMFMNLVAALFMAQLLYMMNSFALFTRSAELCQTMATVQHYCWLASFAWMACLSVDLFHCLSRSDMTTTAHVTPNVSLFIIGGWIIPAFIPLSATVLTATETLAVYDLGLCWLAGPQNTLYFIALPVICIVTINVGLFVGSVYRLISTWKNAAYVRRNEHNKDRLIQCIKLSSWMGISWLFGIIPNFVDSDTLWYVFAASNAFQGVHLFFAFGLSRRARALMRGDDSETNSRFASPPVPSVSGQL